MTGPAGLAFNDPGIADGTIDPQGDSTDGYLYVADPGNHRIQVFDAAGGFKFTFGRGVLTGGDGAEVCDHTQTPCTATVADDEAGELASPRELAINQATGDVYVYGGGFGAGQNNWRIDQFAADGSFIRAWGWGVATGAAGFEICSGNCRAGIAGTAGGQMHADGRGGGIAVDPLPPHHLFFADHNSNRIQEFEGDGDFVRLWGRDVVSLGQPGDLGPDAFEVCASIISGVCKAGNGALPGGADDTPERADKIVVDNEGVVYVAAAQALNRFDSAATSPPAMSLPRIQSSALIQKFESGQGSVVPAFGSDIGALAINPSSGNLLVAYRVGRNRALVSEFDTSVEPPVAATLHMQNPAFPTEATQDDLRTVGLTVNPASGDFYFSGNGSGTVTGHRVFAADDDGATPPPVLSIGDPAAGVSGLSVSLSGEVTPGGPPGIPATYNFQYRKAGSGPTGWVTVAGSDNPLGDGSSPIAVTDTATGLEPNSDYEVRLVARKAFRNAEASTLPQSFTSDPIPPDVETIAPVARGSTSAVLSALVNPNNSPTTYWFEWGETTAYGSTVPVPAASAGEGFGEQLVTTVLEGLDPEATYHYRVVADNGVEVSSGDTEVEGADVSFTTRPATPGPPGRAYELVSPADKLGGVGVGEWYRGPASLAASGFAAYTGERFAAEGSFGSMLLDSAQAYGGDWAFAERAGDQVGWVSRSPLTRANLGPAFASFVNLVASSEDLSRLTANSNNTLLLFPELTGTAWDARWNIPYLLSWGTPTSRWELFGPTDPLLVDEGVPNAPTSTAGVWQAALSDDGSRSVGLTSLRETGIAAVRGMAGPTDPTKAGFDDLVAGRSIYAADTSAEPTDTFATSPRELVNVCSGFGASRTQLPSVNGSGDMTAAACPAAKAGRSERLVSDRGAALNGGTAEPPEDVVSPDGKRVFFLSPDPAAAGVRNGTTEFCSASGQSCPPQLYVRQFNADGSRVTRWISRSAVTGQDATLTGTARFEGASADGDKVFFRTNSPLTADDPNGTGPTAPVGGVKTGTASNASWDLYRYDFPDDPSADPGTGTLTRVSAGPPGGDDGDCNAPYNADGTLNTTQALRFASEDGSRAYFTCAKPLPGVSGGPNGGITTPATGSNPATETNLYLYDANLPAAEGWRFVARLPRSKDAGLNSCASTGYLPRTPINAQGQAVQFSITDAIANCVNGTADGRFITLFTSGRLSADDPASPATGDIYGYEADRDEISRISAPQGGSAGTYACAPSNSAAQCHGDGGVTGGHSVAGPVNAPLTLATDPLTPGAHVAFFQSRSALLPEDPDTNYDVYEWRDGRLHLLTPGTDDHALYKGNDRSGRNVFFASRDALTWQDFDAVGDIYTARVGGGIEEPVRPPVCDALGEACLGVSPAAPAPGIAASPAFSGQGNVIAAKPKPRPRRCAKGKVRKGKRCVLKPRTKKQKRQKRQKKRSAGKNRGAGR